MAVKGYLKIGSRVTITFQAEDTNSGATTLASGTIPSDGDPRLEIIPPGLWETILYDEMPARRALKIEVNVPDEVGSGTLVVTENDIEKNNELLMIDTNWYYILEP